jgi:aminoglycoside phosphotransferase (APT) family kinase protein
MKAIYEFNKGVENDRSMFEPRISQLLDLRLDRRSKGPYQVLATENLQERLIQWLRESSMTVSQLKRMPGGASKEQFTFMCENTSGSVEKLVLRVDPLESIVETCRYREAEVLNALTGRLPLARTRMVDGDGSKLGQPALVTSFVSGVTKPPTDGKTLVSGVGTTFSREWRERLAPQFVGNLAKIHDFDWRSATLPHFSPPTAFPTQAALWQVNWWSRVWREDLVSPYPLLTLAESWMRRNLPICEDPVLLHGDYRTGNFMFDPVSGDMTAVLDWELAHIGDFHEDLAWMMQRLFAGASDEGTLFVCNLITRDELIRQYEAATGRTVNPRTLAFYEVLSAYKCAAMNLGTGAGIAQRGNNHQDLVLSWLSSVGHVFSSEIARMISKELGYES